ncbi:MAG TPA: TetR family transcriptional regulator [Kofleriaceae bacterium]|nr:TetR family transcriptional regulator [Kofleriaceae bacterium]
MERSQTPKGRRARDRILAAAERLIAARGFHGTSMRDIAAAARLPLATTVYHFAKKEQLYAAVLGAIADELDARLQTAIRERDGLDALAVALVRWAAEEPGRVKLLLREVLDNPARVASASRLPLAPFLERASALVAERGAAMPEVAVLHLVGAISYVVAARPTVERIVGTPRAKQILAGYEREAIAFARQMLGVAPLVPPALPTKRRVRTGAA